MHLNTIVTTENNSGSHEVRLYVRLFISVMNDSVRKLRFFKRKIAQFKEFKTSDLFAVESFGCVERLYKSGRMSDEECIANGA